MTSLTTTEHAKITVLAANLATAHKVAMRLVFSITRIDSIFPLNAERLNELDDEEEERIDAFLFRFSSLSGLIQDQLTRSILEFEEEDSRRGSRREARLVMEKLGALKPEQNLGVVAELRNKLVHTYPDDPERQAEILNAVYGKAVSLVEAYNTMLDYAVGRQPDLKDTLEFVSLPETDPDETEQTPPVSRSYGKSS